MVPLGYQTPPKCNAGVLCEDYRRDIGVQFNFCKDRFEEHMNYGGQSVLPLGIKQDC